MTTHKMPPQLKEETFTDRFRSDVDIQPTSYFRWKRLFDVSFSLMLLIPSVPLILVLCAIVRLTSRGPAIFQQRRIGYKGKVFTLYKLRSMNIDAETKSGPVWSTQGDSRVTRVGYWLRKLHLDELPQLFNVLKGDMSLVGPRPERPEFVYVLMDQIPGYMNRLAVIPGITGLAQVNLPPDTDLDSVRRKQILDVQYIENATHSMDLRLFFSTFIRIPLKGLDIVKFLGVNRTVTLDAPSVQEPVQPTKTAPSNGCASPTPSIRTDHDSCVRIAPESTLQNPVSR